MRYPGAGDTDHAGDGASLLAQRRSFHDRLWRDSAVGASCPRRVCTEAPTAPSRGGASGQDLQGACNEASSPAWSVARGAPCAAHRVSLSALLAAVALTVLLIVAPAAAQIGPPVEPGAQLTAPESRAAAETLLREQPDLGLNPVSVLESAARALPQRGDGRGEPQGISAAINILVLLTVIALVPSIMLMCTCFVRIICVLGLLRQAIGTQSLPPPQAILGLSLFLTLMVMTPTIDRIYSEAVTPYREGTVTDHEELWSRAKQPLRDFMFSQIEATGNWSSLYMVLNYRGVDTSEPANITRADVDMVSLVPAFLLSELKVAFVMGFRLYLPFLVIDIVVASLLISMSMMMLPPVLISLPFKLLLFVLVDGWQLVVGSLLESFVVGGGAGAGVDVASAVGAAVEPAALAGMLGSVAPVWDEAMGHARMALVAMMVR